jgi:hypothetical protein
LCVKPEKAFENNKGINEIKIKEFGVAYIKGNNLWGCINFWKLVHHNKREEINIDPHYVLLALYISGKSC